MGRDIKHMRDGVYRISDVESKEVKRISMGIEHLDNIYGGGLPRGRVSIWSGAPGVGKSRMTIEISKNMNNAGLRILVFQNEVSPSEFKNWISGKINNENEYLVSNYSTIEEQIQALYDYAPDLVITDSLNMIQGFNNLTKIRDIMSKFKEAVSEINAHAILIGHLGKDGKTKGSTDITHLVDVVCHIRMHSSWKEKIGRATVTHAALPGIFYILVDKNRYGSSGGYVAFKHHSHGIAEVNSSIKDEVQNDISSSNEKENLLVKFFGGVLRYIEGQTG